MRVPFARTGAKPGNTIGSFPISEFHHSGRSGCACAFAVAAKATLQHIARTTNRSNISPITP
jgi:hypothetical protein